MAHIAASVTVLCLNGWALPLEKKNILFLMWMTKCC